MSERRPAQKGFSLVELMVAMTIGLLLVAGLGWVFLNSSRTNAELAKMNQQMENGRFAITLLKDDLLHAGFWGELASLPSSTGDVDPCKTYSTWDNSDKQNVLSLPIRGYADGKGLPGTCDTLLANRKSDTDVLVVRHVATCTPGSTDCAAGGLAMQVSLCGEDASVWKMEPPGSAALNLRRPDTANRACTHPSYVNTTALARRVIANTYFVRSYAKTVGDNIPTLMVMEPDGSDAKPLVEGIEHFRVEYGIDSAGNDGVPDAYKHDTTTMSMNDWRNVVSARVYLIARNLEATPGYTDTKTYALPGGNVGPFNDTYKRHAYQVTVRLTNVAARRAP
jgi:type IV pilus assembly protein PilW